MLVLGAGFGGLELATVLSRELGDSLDLTLIDSAESFTFGFAKLDVLFGKAAPEAVRIRRELSKPGVRLLRETVTAVDPQARRVTTDQGVHEADHLVLALGAEYDLDATPGLGQTGYEFYSLEGAERLREVLPSFSGGHAVIGVCGAPYKCPPAPSEAALLLDEYLTARGVRDDCRITYVVPTPVPVTSSAEASQALLARFAERGIEFVPGRRVASIDGASRVAVLDDGSELPCDLFLGVPKHRAPRVLEPVGFAEDGFVAVDKATLQTRFPGVYAIGDSVSMPLPKAGAIAEGQARAVAASLLAALRGDPEPPPYRGSGSCYIEFGGGQVARVDVDFSGPAPTGTFNGPSTALAEDKHEFGSSRRARWFGG